MKDKLGEKIMTKFVELRTKTHFQITLKMKKKQNVTKICVIKGKLKFENYKICLEATQLENKINHQEKN